MIAHLTSLLGDTPTDPLTGHLFLAQPADQQPAASW